ncbi:AAA family ATPase [Pleomorphomonas sp. JP5]|uniref:AAA family ATPase n=1 Tax=Pleomorphomonas sp. JP5 TaxID=2942998 RepID=UPI002043377B|nr:AAA family ATPase [Pleomorphomonas sp. JP5]MCM5559313.1 ATP-binding protein [Pleomorphomonas sp. JP5]
MSKVIYLTGAPASGKTTTVDEIEKRKESLFVWRYSKRLIEYMEIKYRSAFSHENLRSLSSAAVSAQDIADLDVMMIDFIRDSRAYGDVIIDSHAISYEVYGFRSTSFSINVITQLQINEIWVLFASPETIVSRTAVESKGRRIVTLEEARMMTELQSSLALTYGVVCGCPVYFFNTEIPQLEMYERMLKRLK